MIIALRSSAGETALEQFSPGGTAELSLTHTPLGGAHPYRDFPDKTIASEQLSPTRLTMLPGPAGAPATPANLCPRVPPWP
ncbi:MAG: hypothetical protein WBQ00_01315, partial [Terriglobales bacterium]